MATFCPFSHVSFPHLRLATKIKSLTGKAQFTYPLTTIQYSAGQPCFFRLKWMLFYTSYPEILQLKHLPQAPTRQQQQISKAGQWTLHNLLFQKNKQEPSVPNKMQQNRAKVLKTHWLQNHHVNAGHHKNTRRNTAVTANSYY